MAMLLDDLGDYLSSAGVGLTAGTNLFLGYLPDTPDAAVAIFEAGGRPPAHAMNASAGQAVAEYPRVQVLSRAGAFAYNTARQRMHNVYMVLDGMPARTINTTTYQWATAVQPPFLMHRDGSNRPVIACNFDIAKKLATSTST